MFFFLSKTIYFLCMPLTLVIAAFLFSIFIKRYRKTFFWIGFGLLLFFSNQFISNLVVRGWEVSPVPIASLDRYPVGIVLGGLTTDKEPRDRVHVTGSADRILHAIQLYREGKIRKILVSGGSGHLLGDSLSEAALLRRVLRLSKIPKRDILIEDQARNTRENALNCAELLGVNPQKEYLLITSGYHMRRAKACFQQAGLSVQPYSTDLRSDEIKFTPDLLFIPSTAAIAQWEIVIKEMIGMVAYGVMGYT